MRGRLKGRGWHEGGMAVSQTAQTERTPRDGLKSA